MCAYLDRNLQDRSIGKDRQPSPQLTQNRQHVLHKLRIDEADFRMEVRSVYNVNKILQYTRAFMRVRKGSVLIKKGLEPAKYLRDDYEKSP